MGSVLQTGEVSGREGESNIKSVCVATRCRGVTVSRNPPELFLFFTEPKTSGTSVSGWWLSVVIRASPEMIVNTDFGGTTI